MASRGVLLDVARTKGVRWLEAGVGVMPEDLEEAEKAAGVRVESGDILLVRTGYYGQSRKSRSARSRVRAQARAQSVSFMNHAVRPYSVETCEVEQPIVALEGYALLEDAAEMGNDERLLADQKRRTPTHPRELILR